MASSLELLLLAMAVLIATATVLGEIVVHRLRCWWLSESAVSIIVGLVAGLVFYISYVASADADAARRAEMLEFEPVFFTLVLLPPIIFESGYNLNHSAFFRNWDAILAFAFGGTLVASAVIGLVLYYGLGGSHGLLTPMEAAAFASLIAAVDPVATLSIFGTTNADPTLYAVIFGESVLNDAVAIVLFKTVVSLGVNSSVGIGGFGAFTAADFFGIVGAFLLVFLGSVVVGAFSGLSLALTLKLTRLSELSNAAAAELMVLVCFSYAQFILAEFAGLSGIVATLFCGATSVTYASRNMSAAGQQVTKFAVKLLARVTDTIIFILIGTGFWLYTLGDGVARQEDAEVLDANPQVGHCRLSLSGSQIDPYFISITLAMCLISRVLSVFPLAFVVNCFRSAHKRIRLNEQAVIWFSGLRGAIALALAVEFPELPLTLGKPGEGNFCFQRDEVVACTIIVVVCTVLLLGGLTQPVLRLCGIRMGEHPQDKMWSLRTKSRWKRAVKLFDAAYIRPRMISNYEVPPEVQDAFAQHGRWMFTRHGFAAGDAFEPRPVSSDPPTHRVGPSHIPSTELRVISSPLGPGPQASGA